MTTRTIVVAPHPDDEVLGVGGTLLRRKAEGGESGMADHVQHFD